MFFYFFDEETGKTEQMSVVDLPEDVQEQVLNTDFEFFNENIRYVWHKQEEEYYFSVLDVIYCLTNSADPKQYIKKMRTRDPELNSNWGTICTLVPMVAKDNKIRKIHASTMEGLLRIIQSVPSPKAEPIKQWLAQVGNERLNEMIDPEIAINRAVEYYKKKGYADKWISQRLRGIEVRKEFTDEWKRSGVKGREFAILTDVLTKEWSGMNTRQYKDYKKLHKENLRDNMTNTELALNLLAEVSTTELSKEKNPDGFSESAHIAKQGGEIAGNARKELEKALGKSIISKLNAKDIKEIE